MPDSDPSGTILVKYGGNAMVDPAARDAVLDDLAALHADGHRLVVVHGGGPAIGALLEAAGIVSEFVGGHRRTDADAIRYVEMALRGGVNGELVEAFCARGRPAVGLSGKDAGMVRARRRYHQPDEPGSEPIDIGFVGDIESVDVRLVSRLLDDGDLPVVAPLALGTDGRTYNVNADVFAGHLAAALKVDRFVALTDVDGLRRVPEDASTVIRRLARADIGALMGTSITGGMIPKIEACCVALDGGVASAHIVDGTSAGSVRAAIDADPERGTEIRP